MDYMENRNEKYIGEKLEEVIPVAMYAEEGEKPLLPKKEESDDLVIKYKKPYNFEGEIHTELDLHGLEDLRGRDLTNIEKAFNKSGVSSFTPESTTTYAKIVATKVTGLPAEYFEDLPVREVEKIKVAVINFFYKDE